MKTLCYKVAYREDRYKEDYLLYDDGFILIEIDDNNMLSRVEGLLTFDYFKFVITDSNIKIQIYTRDYRQQEIQSNASEKGKIPMTLYLECETPVNLFPIPFKIKFSNYQKKCQFEIIRPKPFKDVNKYEERLKQFKQNVFIDERS